jgi:tetratricopeptide (TPR) repeat protein
MLKAMLYSLSAAALLAAAPVLHAQAPATDVTIQMKDGKSVTTLRLRRDGASVMVAVKLGAGMGEVGYPVANIERINFPEPAALKQARDLVARGKSAEALGVLRPVVDYYEPFRDIPGGYWGEATLLRVNALISSGREGEAGPLIQQLAQVSTDPELLNAAKVQQAASWARKGQHEKALGIYDQIIKASTDRDALASAWLNKGHSLLALKKWEPAALAYLHIPVFYSSRTLLMPKALKGASQALAGLGDYAGAIKRLEQIVQDFPSSPEAAEVKAEIEKLKLKQ